MRKSTISILDKELLYRDKRIRFTPLKDGGIENDDSHSFTVNGDDDSLKILHFEDDCVTFIDDDGSTIRFDPRNYRTTILPVPVKFDGVYHDTDIDGLITRSYNIVDDNGNPVHIQAVEILDYTLVDDNDYDEEASKYSGELVLEIYGAPCLLGEYGTSDRELLTAAGFQLIGEPGDED